MSENKKSTNKYKRLKKSYLFFLLLIAYCSLLVVCENNWIIKITDPLWEDECAHEWNWETEIAATVTADGTERRECILCGEEETRTQYATGTLGLAYELIGNAYRVRAGTVNGGAVFIPAYHRPNVNSPYLPVTQIGAIGDITSDGAFRNTDIVSVSGGVNVTLIGSFAFIYDNQSYLASVDLPNAIAIGEGAFYNCNALSSVNFPEVISIGDDAFYGSGLTIITNTSFPKVKTIGEYAFAMCPLVSVSFPEVVTVDSSAFRSCNNLNSISFPKATSIGGSAFANCSNLSSTNIPEAINIGASSFAECSSLISVSIPKATTIDNYAFFNCTSLSTVTFGGSLVSASFHTGAFTSIGDLRDVYFAPGGGAGTYTRTPPATAWTKS